MSSFPAQLGEVFFSLHIRLYVQSPQFYKLRQDLVNGKCVESVKPLVHFIGYHESLDLTREQRIIINDYIACTSTVNHRYSDIAYMCGIKNTVEMLVSLGLIKGMGEKN